MPIDINEYANPIWVKYKEGYPWVDDRNYNFEHLTINPRMFVRRYQSSEEELGWKAPGYNPNHNSIRVERVIISRDIYSLKPY